MELLSVLEETVLSIWQTLLLTKEEDSMVDALVYKGHRGPTYTILALSAVLAY